jgi:glutathione S-transferase
MKQIDPFLNKKTKFLFGDRLTIADFWIGGMYVNWAKNPIVAVAKEEWK